MAREENLGFRCQEVSTRHRRWGVVPACDLDFPLLHYHNRKVVALIELKYYKAFPALESASLKALTDLGDRAGVPVFLANYKVSTWIIEVYALNDLAKKTLGRSRKEMSEREWIIFLHALRGQEAPADVLEIALDWPALDEPGELRPA